MGSGAKVLPQLRQRSAFLSGWPLSGLTWEEKPAQVWPCATGADPELIPQKEKEALSFEAGACLGLPGQVFLLPGTRTAWAVALLGCPGELVLVACGALPPSAGHTGPGW